MEAPTRISTWSRRSCASGEPPRSGQRRSSAADSPLGAVRISYTTEPSAARLAPPPPRIEVQARILCGGIGRGGAIETINEILPEEWLASAVGLLVRLVEIAGAVVIFTGALVSFIGFVITSIKTRDPKRFVPIRLTLGRFLTLGLEFQLASDLLRTAVAPSFDQIGKLAAIVAIRTGLNYFLGLELAAARDPSKDDPG